MHMDCGKHSGRKRGKCREYNTHAESKKFEGFAKIMKALHCPTRWMIIECLKEEKSTQEILDCLFAKNERITLTGLYYHLSELRNAGIIEIAGYREGQGAPQKIWRLKVNKIEIPLVEDYERH